MFTRLNPDTVEMVSISFDNQTMKVRKGLTVAAALLEANVGPFRQTPVSGKPRAPFCMMGVCFDCLVIIDGIANQQSCLTEVCEGMRIERQMGPADIVPEKLENQGTNS